MCALVHNNLPCLFFLPSLFFTRTSFTFLPFTGQMAVRILAVHFLAGAPAFQDHKTFPSFSLLNNWNTFCAKSATAVLPLRFKFQNMRLQRFCFVDAVSGCIGGGNEW